MDAGTFANDLFLNRFEPDGEDFIYRQNLRAPGLRVTSAERARMIEERKKRQRGWTWIYGVAISIGIVLWIFVEDNFRLATALEAEVITGVALFAAFIFAMWSHVYFERRAVRRFLKDRPIAAPARSKEEARRVHFGQMTWTQIGGLASLLIAVLFRFAIRNHFLIWEDRYWIGGIAILFFCVFGLIAYRKWRWGRQQ